MELISGEYAPVTQHLSVWSLSTSVWSGPLAPQPVSYPARPQGGDKYQETTSTGFQLNAAGSFVSDARKKEWKVKKKNLIKWKTLHLNSFSAIKEWNKELLMLESSDIFLSPHI